MKKIDFTFLHPHKIWLSFLSVTIITPLIALPLMNQAETNLRQNLNALTNQHVQAEKNLQQLRDDTVAAEKLRHDITPEQAEALLAPVDRLMAAAALEQAAADAENIHSFTYNFSPEQKTQITANLVEAQDLSLSTLTLHGEAPTDLNAYRLIDAVRTSLPGRLRLKQLTLERLSSNAAPTALNIRFNASFEWLSNGSTTETPTETAGTL